MACFQPFILFCSVYIPFCKAGEMWMLDAEETRRTSGNIVPSKIMLTMSTSTRLSCAVLCLQEGSCLFYGYRNHDCRGYTISSTGLGGSHPEMPTIKQGHFRRYSREAQAGGNIRLDGYERLSSGKITLNIKQHNYRKSFKEAVHVCQTENATLVQLDTKEKSTLFLQAIQHRNAIRKRFWIGLTDRYDNDTWYWPDGTDLSIYSNWKPEEPHNFHNEVAENCAALDVQLFCSGKWYDTPCKNTRQFVCERV